MKAILSMSCSGLSNKVPAARRYSQLCRTIPDHACLSRHLVNINTEIRLNYMKIPVKVFCFLLFAATAGAQSTTTISGRLTDAVNGEVLIGATVEAVGLLKGNSSNEYGFYSFTLPNSADSLTLRFNYIGYETVFRRVKASGAAIRLDVALQQEGAVLEEVVIRANPLEEKVKSTEMSVMAISTREA